MTVPDDLSELAQWVLWRRENDTKVPYRTNGRRASSTDPTHWGEYAEVIEVLRRHPDRYAGLGFVFCGADPFCGIDLDDCLDAGGTPKAWARGVVERFADTYAEVSPSGRGLKIWCRAAMERNLGKVAIEGGGIEIYTHARFFTVTGRRFREAPLQVEHHQTDVDALLQHLRRPTRALIGSDGKIPYGRQHWTLVSLAGTLRRRGVCREAIEACLQVVNARQCERPGLPANISKIADSAGRWPITDGSVN